MASVPEPAPAPGALAQRVALFVGWLLASKPRGVAVLIVSLLLMAGAISYGASIEINTDLRRLLPKSSPSVAALDELEQRKGSAEGFVIAIEAPTAAEAQLVVDAIADEVRSWPETDTVSVDRDYTTLRAHALYMLELEQLEQLRDELKAERQKAVARVMGPGLVDGEVDPSELGGDDWDDVGGGELDWGPPANDPAANEPAANEPAANDPKPDAKPEDEPVDIQRFLSEQRQKLIDQGTLDADEVALIWPEENERGEIEWAERVGMPYSAQEGTVRTIHANLSTPATDVQFAQDAVARVEQRAEELRATAGLDPSTRVQVVAAYNISAPVNTIVRDARRATWISALATIAVLLIGFRSARILPLVIVPMGVAMGTTLAVAKFGYGSLNALTVFLFAVLFGMGVDFSVHLFALRQAQGREADWPKVVRNHFRPLVSTMLTTAASLLVLTLAEFQAFREFGVISAVGVVLCFIAAVVLVPITDHLLGPLRRAPEQAASAAVSQPSHAASPVGPAWVWIGRLRWVVLAALAVVAIYGAPKLSMEKDTRVLNASNAEDAGSTKEIAYRQTGGRYKSLALLADNPEQLAIAVDRMLELERSAEILPNAIDTGSPRRPWIKEVFSLRTVLPTDQERKAVVIAEIARQVNDLLAELPDLDEEARRHQTHLEALEHMAKSDPLTVDELPDWAIEPFRERDGHADQIAHVYLEIAGWSIDELVAVRERLDALLGDTTVQSADSRLVFADLMQVVERDAKRIPIYALVTILLFIAIDLRRPVGTAACFASLGLGVTLGVGIMGLWPLHLNFFNLVVMPAVVGLGIDASIHLWHGREKPSLAATSKASLLAALTTVAGFSGLLAANHAGLRSIGEVGVMAILSCVGVAFLALYPLKRGA